MSNFSKLFVKIIGRKMEKLVVFKFDKIFDLKSDENTRWT